MLADCQKLFAGDIVSVASVSTTAADFSVEYTKAKDAGAQILYAVMSGTNCTPSVKQWYDMQLPMLYLSHNVEAQAPNFWEVTDGKCEGVVSNRPGAIRAPISPLTIPWYDEYIKKYGEPPQGYTNSIAYNVVMAWAQAVKKAGTIDPDKLIPIMENIKYEGIIGKFNGFTKFHTPNELIYPLLQWQKGKQVVIEGYFKDGEMILPDWLKKLLKK